MARSTLWLTGLLDSNAAGTNRLHAARPAGSALDIAADRSHPKRL